MRKVLRKVFAEGFAESLAKAGIKVSDQEFYSGGSSLAKGRDMKRDMLMRSPDLDFLYYSSDKISAGGLLYLLEQGLDIPDKIGLAGFNGVELLQGLPVELATMDACRKEVGQAAAKMLCDKLDSTFLENSKVLELTPTLSRGETLRQLY